MTVSGAAFAGTVGMDAPGAGVNDWRDEPNIVPASPTDECKVPNDFYFSTPADYQCAWDDEAGWARATNADHEDNGARILQGKYVPYLWPHTVTCGTWTGVGCSGVFTPDYNRLLDRFALSGGRDFMLPAQQGTIVAFLGTWDDVDEDGYRDSMTYYFRDGVGGGGHARPVYINADSDDECERQTALPVTNDPTAGTDTDGRPGHGRDRDTDGDGDIDNNDINEQVADGDKSEEFLVGGNTGNLAPATAHPQGLAWRCTVAEEWAGEGGKGIGLVGYSSPTDWRGTRTFIGSFGPGIVNGGGDHPVVCPVLVWSDIDDCGKAARRDQRPVDLTFSRSDDFYGKGGYLADQAVATGVIQDGSMIETRVIELISDTVTSASAWRAREATADSVFDTDFYVAIDDDIEDLYQGTAHSGLGAAFDGVNATYNAEVVSRYDGARVAANLCDQELDESAFCALGPTTSTVFPPWEVDTGPAHDFEEGYHLYMNLRLVESTATCGAATCLNTFADSFAADQDGAGSEGVLLRLGVRGVFGAWHDKNKDGFIGDPETRDGCADQYNCGAWTTPGTSQAAFDPNVYAIAASNGEWKPTCIDRSKTTPSEPSRKGSIYVRLTPIGGAVDGDGKPKWGTHGAYMWYDDTSGVNTTQGGVANFNPYDDFAADATGGFTRLVESGAITIEATCTGNNGFYRNFQEVWVTGGSSQHGVSLQSERVIYSYEDVGIVDESTFDDDVNGKWDL